MCQRLEDELQKGRGSADGIVRGRWDALAADVSHFVEGSFINWGLMKWLDPKKYEHWELKSVRPRPSLRVFGRFVEPDVFVGTHTAVREHLGGKWTLQWELEKLTCEEIWNDALAIEPFSAENYEDYISFNASRDLKVLS